MMKKSIQILLLLLTFLGTQPILAGSTNGYPFIDSNFNSIDNGEPRLAGVVVENLDGGNNKFAEMTTGASGEFGFTGLMPGTYTIEAIDDPNDDLVPTTPTSSTVELLNGQELVANSHSAVPVEQRLKSPYPV